MAVPRESTSTGDVLADARFHRASIKADPETTHLAERVEVAERGLRERRNATEVAEDARIELFARLLRADFELDERTRLVELDVLGAVAKDRAHVAYRACFPRGLTDLLATRGEEQARETRALADALRARLPELAARHADALASLGEAVTAAERAWLDGERAAATAAGEERIARTDLIRQLQRNEGALAELFPGERRRVRSYFRPTRRRGAVTPEGRGTPAAG